MHKIIAFASVILLLGTSLLLAQQEESITFTTYYPSPYGVYNELQLYPHSLATTTCDDAHKGTMYYDSDDDQLYVCKGTIKGWESVGAEEGYWKLSGSDLYPTDENWKVGIGLSYTIANLHVVGDSSLGSVLIAPDQPWSGGNSELRLAEDRRYRYGMSIKYDGGVNKMYIYGKTPTTTYGPHVTIHNWLGKVGIGTGATSPTQQLDVAGKIRMRTQTATGDADDIVATKGYVDSVGAAGGAISVWSGSDGSNTGSCSISVPEGFTVIYAHSASGGWNAHGCALPNARDISCAQDTCLGQTGPLTRTLWGGCGIYVIAIKIGG